MLFKERPVTLYSPCHSALQWDLEDVKTGSAD